jgi:hypothetical protein
MNMRTTRGFGPIESYSFIVSPDFHSAMIVRWF